MMQVQILHLPSVGTPDQLLKYLDHGISVEWGDPLELGRTDFEVLVAGRPSLAQLLQSPNLMCLVIPFSGIPAETRTLLLDHFPNLPVYNLHHNAIATAEMAMALLFAVAKNIVPGDRALRQHDWRIRYLPNKNIILSESSATILGYGAVGKTIAGMCRAFGMEVHAIRRGNGLEEKSPGISIHKASALDDLLPRSDILFVALPLTSDTEGLLNRDRLGKLPEHCILVNVARGGVVEEEALYESLMNGWISGAGIDVWYYYPEDEAARAHTPPSTLPFHELENVVMSPHRAGGSRVNEYLRFQHLAQLLNDLANGRTPETRVDVLEGY